MTDYYDLPNVETDPLNLEGAIALFRDHQAFKQGWYSDEKFNNNKFSHLADKQGVMKKIDEVLTRLHANDIFTIFVDSSNLKIKTLIEMERFGQVTSFLLERVMDLPYLARRQVVSKINQVIKPAIRKWKFFPDEVLNFYRLADALELSVSSDVCGEALRSTEFGLKATNWMGLSAWLKARESSRILHEIKGLSIEDNSEKVAKEVTIFLQGEWRLAVDDFPRIKAFCDEFVLPELLQDLLVTLHSLGEHELAEFLG
jgi:hypothetical protein